MIMFFCRKGVSTVICSVKTCHYAPAGALAESELSAQDKSLPALLSKIMVCVSIGLPVSL